MSTDKPALLKESISFKKSNDSAVFKGELELYDDRVVLKISHRLALSALVRHLPPTFPDVETRESIPFSHITGISQSRKRSVVSRSVKVEVQTEEGVTLAIRGRSRIFDVLQKAYQAWKQRGHQ